MLEHSSLVRLIETYDVEIEWRGFQLHPEIPPGGASLEDLFGPRAAKMRERVVEIAAEFGVELKAPERAPSTVAPLAATEKARELGGLDRFRDAVMHAYWRDGRDIESEQVLRECAATAELDPDAIASAATAPEAIAKVTAAREDAYANNITAIPTLIVSGFPIVGCQRWETYERVLDKLGCRRRRNDR